MEEHKQEQTNEQRLESIDQRLTSIEILLRESKFNDSVFERIAALIKEQSEKAIALREGDSRRLEVIEDSILSKTKEVAVKTKEISLKNRISIKEITNLAKLLFTAVIVLIVLNLFWTVLPIKDRQEIARKGLLPAASFVGLGAIVFIYGKEISMMIGLGSSDDDDEQDEDESPKKENV